MASGNVRTGDNGKVFINAVEFEVTKWTHQAEVETERFTTSMTGGFKRTEVSARSSTGTVEFKRTTGDGRAEVLIKEGDKAALKLHWDATNHINLPSAVCKNLQFDTDPGTGAVESGSFNFESDGIYSYVTSSVG